MLVRGDDFNEPVSDAVRSILVGHIVLSRDRADQGHYLTIDVLKSGSRLRPDVTPQPLIRAEPLGSECRPGRCFRDCSLRHVWLETFLFLY